MEMASPSAVISTAKVMQSQQSFGQRLRERGLRCPGDAGTNGSVRNGRTQSPLCI